MCVASLAVVACGLRAEEKPAAPKYVPLSPGRAVVEGDNLRCTRTVVVKVPYLVKTREQQGGKTVITKVETAWKSLAQSQTRLIPLREVRAFVTTGRGTDPTKLLRPLDIAKLKERLAKDTRVFFLPDAGKMDPAFARELKAGTVVLVLPPKVAPRPPQSAEKR
jgi:hypothetical protein